MGERMEVIRPDAPLHTLPALWIFCLFFALAGAHLASSGRWSVALEGVATVGILMILVSLRPFQAFYRRMPAKHRLAFAFLIGLMLCGHFAERGRQTFPFVPWRMFASKPSGETIEHIRIDGITDDGTRITINPERLFPSLGLGTSRLYLKLSSLTKAALNTVENPAVARQRYEDMLLAIGRAHNRKADPLVQRLEVVKIHTSLDRATPTGREIVWQVNLR
jgi:hypothetical protein